VEKYLIRPRHIEIQVFADNHGNCVYLFERDCSVQRRHQKVLEEAPAPGMDPARRREMGAAAVAAARAVGYVGAGTVEFIVNQDGRFFFMEMNTRLQVEHPVTEMITGLDLVEWQLRVAFGECLPLAQEQLQINGHALEARIYAEDPAKGFLPSTGRLIHLAPPRESMHVRVDTGVEENDEITPFYDPMIAKLIVWDQNRERALARMLLALANYQVVGVANNIDFLSRLVACPAFASSDLDTGLIEREQDYLFPAAPSAADEIVLVTALAELLWEVHEAGERAALSADAHSPWRLLDGWRLNAVAQRTLLYREQERQHAVTVDYQAGGFKLTLNGHAVCARGELQPHGQMRIELDGVRMSPSVIAAGHLRHVFLHGRAWQMTRVDPLQQSGENMAAPGGFQAPMPGRIIALLAPLETEVAKGTPLLIMEAMKMEHTLTAPARGQVKCYCYAEGDQVSDGAELLEFEPA